MNAIKQEKAPINFLQTILGFKSQIGDLPVSQKKAECTVQRFMLYLLPAVNLAATVDYLKTKKLFSELLDILAQSKNYAVSVKVSCLLHMYNSTSKGLKAMVFKTLVQLCQQEG